MKKLLLIIILVLMLVLTGVTVIRGINISNISIMGIMQMKEESDNLDNKLQEATKLASTDYKKAQKDLETKVEELKTQKQSLQELLDISTDVDSSIVTKINSPYKIDYLWITIGNYAKSEGVTMKMDTVKNGGEYEGSKNILDEKDKIYYYDISFTITGNYVNIAEFIIDIEDDSSLGFKIEEFNMSPSSEAGGNTVEATFKCKNILIQGASSNTATTSNVGEDIDTDADKTTNKTVTNSTTTNTTNNTTNTAQ